MHFVELERNNIDYLDIPRKTRMLNEEHRQNLKTDALINLPGGRLMVESLSGSSLCHNWFVQHIEIL